MHFRSALKAFVFFNKTEQNKRERRNRSLSKEIPKQSGKYGFLAHIFKLFHADFFNIFKLFYANFFNTDILLFHIFSVTYKFICHKPSYV